MENLGPDRYPKRPHLKAQPEGPHASGWPRHGMDTLTRRILTLHDTELIGTIDIDTPRQATFGT